MPHLALISFCFYSDTHPQQNNYLTGGTHYLLTHPNFVLWLFLFRYGNIKSEVVWELYLMHCFQCFQIPEFDNLYLDMNGIIHQCSHPNDEDVHFRISEEKIFADIFHYLEVLFRIIKPRKVFFMAVDGVAPRAKMNQQRGRRFR